jgi:hypothetical protein
VTRTTQCYAAVQQRRAHGESISAISRRLHLDVQTVRRFAHAPSLDQLLAKTAERASVLDGFTAYLHQRWNEGCTDESLVGPLGTLAQPSARALRSRPAVAAPGHAAWCRAR